MKRRTIDAYYNEWLNVLLIPETDFKKSVAKIGIELPNELEEFLMKCNGGYPQNNTYFGYYEVSVGNILCVGDKPTNKMLTLEEVYDCIKEKQADVLEELIPFASDTGNANLFCYHIKSGAVVYLLNDGETKTISNSFSEFIVSLEKM